MPTKKAKEALREELRKAQGDADVNVLLRLQAVADHLDGAEPHRVGLDYEIPSGTVSRWTSVALSSGAAGLISIQNPEISLDRMHCELPAAAAVGASPGVERTALLAIAAMCRGASVDEICAYHAAAADEVREWIDTYLTYGAVGIRERYRHPAWSPQDPEQVFLARRRLPYGMSATFLRELHVRSRGDFAQRLLVMALLYEGRTVRQAAAFVGVEAYTAGVWVRDFIRSGLAGIAERGLITRVPSRREFGASSVAQLAAGITNPEMRKRLSVVELAYRAVPLRDIGNITGMSSAKVASVIRAFEDDGPEGLSTGEATLTPPLRADYDAARLRDIADGMLHDEPGRRRMEALAMLYDGCSMMDAGRHIGGLPAIRLLVDRFVRFGHEIAESFQHWMRPVAPPARKPPAPPPPPPRPPEMRTDLNRMRMDRVRDAYNPEGRQRIDIIMDAYSGRIIEDIVRRRHRSAATVRAFIDKFNAEGLEWLEPYRKKPRKPRRVDRHGVQVEAVARIQIRRDIKPDVILAAMHRSVDDAHRFDLRIVHALYVNDGVIADIPAEMGVTQTEVSRLAAAFDLYGETFGQASLRRKMLPADWDMAALAAAQKRPDPLRSYAHVVAWLYAGVPPETVRRRFEMPQGELEAIVTAFRDRGVAGLEADPLGIAAKLPRHADILPSPPVPPPAPAPVRSAPVVAPNPPATVAMRPSKPVAREYKAPAATVRRQPVEVVAAEVTTMYEGRNARRLEAVREFNRIRDIRAVSARFGVSTATIEKWVVEYVKSGMAEIDRKAAR